MSKDRYEKLLEDHVATERAALASTSAPTTTHVCRTIEEFVASFSTSTRRKPLLLLVGGTQLGKSMLAEQILRKIGAVLGLADFLEVTVEDNADIDLSLFRVDQHAGVLLDGIANIEFLKRHRESLQGRTKICRGGRSTTMMYSYPYSLCRRGVVATADLSARNLHLLRTDHWLCDPRNVQQVWLMRPAWLATEANIHTIMQEGPQQAPLQEWSTEELAARISAEDAQGLVPQLLANAVTGSDFANLDEEAFITMLRYTPFAARKLAALKTKFLTSGHP